MHISFSPVFSAFHIPEPARSLLDEYTDEMRSGTRGEEAGSCIARELKLCGIAARGKEVQTVLAMSDS